MSVVSMVVPQDPPHKISRGGLPVGKNYDETLKLGNTTVHIVYPSITEEEKDRRVKAMYRAAWNAWNSLPVERRLQINAECEAQAQK